MNTATQPPIAADFKAYRVLDNEILEQRIADVRAAMGKKLIILGHHYQQDEVIALSDQRGDSLKLSQIAAESSGCEAIVFCGVHFMAETADILVNRPEKIASRSGLRVPVVLPDMAAGCSMADMAAIEQVENAWDELGDVIDTDDVTPVTYINSAASLKAFCGRNGGIVCTSSNAEKVLRWAFERTSRVLFFPDQHLGRNTARGMGVPLEQMPVWNPFAEQFGGNTEKQIADSRVLLWQGHCSVHQMFTLQHVQQLREKHPDIKILVHPECPMEVFDAADYSGSTGKIIEVIKQAPKGSRWAIGTELHLVNRLNDEHPDLEIQFLSPVVCMCATMYRIDLAHLCWSLEHLSQGTPVNVIEVDEETSQHANVALDRMLNLG